MTPTNARRGFVPEDIQNFFDAALAGLRRAASDACALLDRCASWINMTGCLAESRGLPLIQIWTP